MRKIIITSFLLLFTLFLNATEYMFRHLEIKDGLSNHQVNHIFKDKEGFMWFSTASGLNRYDGNEMIHFSGYNFEKDPLADNYIYDVQQDYWGSLWIHTAQGYSLYDPTTELFEKDTRNWMINHGMDAIPTLTYIDSNQQMWIYTSKGINLFIPQTKLLYTLYYSNELMPTGKLSKITESREGILLLFEEGKIVCLERENGKVKWELTGLTQQVAGAKHIGINAMTDTDGDIWIYSSLGVRVYNPTLKKWLPNLVAPLKGKQNKSIQAITQDAQGNIWIGSKEEGIELLDKKSLQTTQLVRNNQDQRTLQSNAIQSLYTDSYGTVWIGTTTKGVSYYNENSFKFGFKSIGEVSAIEEEKEGAIWVGLNSGVFRWNKSNNEVTAIKDPKGVLAVANITALLQSKDGTMWIATQRHGLLSYYKERFNYYEYSPTNSTSLASNSINSLAQDNEGNIWIGTNDSGVQLLNPKTNQFTTYHTENSEIASNQVNSLCMTSRNQLAIGTERGVSMLSLYSRNIAAWNGSQSGNATLPSLRITQLYEDSRGLLWIGTSSGLSSYQQQNDELKNITIYAEKENQTISAIIEDTNQNIWVSTLTEIATITPSLNERGGYEYETYLFGKRNGLQQGQFNPRAIERISSGQLLFGGTYGINYLIPNLISYNKIYPKVRFTHLYLSHKEIKVGEQHEGQIVLQHSLNSQKKITLSPQKEVIDIHFSADDYVVPQGVTYSYKLEGFNKEWITTNEGKVTYLNLESGQYTLRVKVINSDGFSNGEEFTLAITITTPLIATIGNYLFYLLLAVALLLALYFVLRNQKQRRERETKKGEAGLAPNKQFGIEEEFQVGNSSYQTPSKESTTLTNGMSNTMEERKESYPTESTIKESEQTLDQQGVVEEVNSAIYTIDNIVNLEEEESATYPSQDTSHLTTIQIIPLDSRGEEHLELIQTAVAKRVDYEEKKEEEEEKEVVETTKEIIKKRTKASVKSHRPTLLVVDDNEDVLAFIYEKLQQEYDLVMAPDGYEAWKLMESLTPDLIISDLEMPHIDGNELSRLVRSKEELAQIPFILLLSRQPDHTSEIATEVSETVTKPFNKATLVAKIQSLLEARSLQLDPRERNKIDSMTITPSDEKLVEKAVKYVEKNISNSQLSVEELSKALNTNRVDLYKKLSNVTGRTPVEFIRFIRMKRAAQLFREEKQSKSEVAFQVGFTNLRSFEKFFEKEYGDSDQFIEKGRTEL
ncbi:MAG: two-component regulator propeller domain-containing protein [Phocaeicola sp.]